jgi:hypothetical protein
MLDALNCPYALVLPRAQQLPERPRGTVYCVDSRLAGELSHLPDRTVIMLSGALVPDGIVSVIQLRHVRTLRLDDVNPRSLLTALLSATTGTEVEGMAERLRGLAMFHRVEAEVVNAFLRAPARMFRLEDLRRALAPLSREAAQGLVRAAGFHRAEHLFTALRVGTGALLQEAGLEPREVEEYLGILDRGSLRRACRRAGVPALARGLCPEALDVPSPGCAGAEACAA